MASHREVDDILDLSPLQQGMLFHSLLDPDGGFYFEQVTFAYRGNLDPDCFQRAWNHVGRRHQLLRASFVWKKVSKPVQVIHREAPIPIRFEDWSRQSEPEQVGSLQTFLLADRRTGLELDRAPLIRIALFRLKPRLYQLVASFHHAILDGWSLNLLFREFHDAYRTFESGRTPNPSASPRYSDFIAWLRARDPGEAEAFWRPRLVGYRRPAPLPGDRARMLEVDPDQGVDSRSITLPLELSTDLGAVARRQKVTLNVILQAAWAILLHRYLEVDDIVFGAVVSGRPPDLEAVERIIGLFINTVPLRVRVRDEDRATDVVQALHELQLGARDVEYCALSQITGWTDAGAGERLFDTLFIFENLPGTGGAGAVSAFAFERTNYPITLLVAPGPNIGLKVLFAVPRLDAPAIELLLGQYRSVLEQIAEWPERSIGHFDCRARGEELLEEGEAGGAARPSSACGRLEDVWSRRVEETPDAVAILWDGRPTTVSELDRMADSVGAHLAERGIAPGEVVGVFLPPSPALVATMLGCLKQGIAFLLLDPEYPAARNAAMLTLAGASAAVADGDGPARLPTRDGVETIDLSAVGQIDPARIRTSAGPDDLAYLVFTSGSSGRPKGVMQTHRATLNRLRWMWRAFPFEPGEVCCQKTALGFVDVIAEILGPVLGGAPLAILGLEARTDPAAMIRELGELGVTRIIVVPSLLSELLDRADLLEAHAPGLRFWVSSGEALSGALAARFRQLVGDATLVNLYGASEVAADVTFEVVSKDPLGLPVPIGRPIDHTRVYVLDGRLAPAPAGVPGELYVSGTGLARGYADAPGLTAARFLPDPFQAGGRMYRTGDRGRRLPDGRLEFIGRADHQIKLRGQRIEPAEVEAALLTVPGVSMAAVSKTDDGVLVAALKTEGGVTLDPDALRTMLGRSLPNFMIPDRVAQCTELPELPNGKIDRSRIGALVSGRPARRRRRAEPATETERRLAAIWTELLGITHISRDDDFFALGGHSILTMQLASRVTKRLGVELPIRVVFETPTVRALAARIDQLREAPKTERPPALERRPRSRRWIP